MIGSIVGYGGERLQVFTTDFMDPDPMVAKYLPVAKDHLL